VPIGGAKGDEIDMGFAPIIKAFQAGIFEIEGCFS
jgi:hypothetical protein